MKAHFILYVGDQARAARFYADVLGLRPALDVPGMTEFALATDAVLGLMPVSGIERLLGVTVSPMGFASVVRAELYVHVEDVDAAYHRAIEAGARSLSAPASRDWGDRVAYVRDLDGHVLAFARRIEGA